MPPTERITSSFTRNKEYVPGKMSEKYFLVDFGISIAILTFAVLL
jgi:hypothetical protein